MWSFWRNFFLTACIYSWLQNGKKWNIAKLSSSEYGDIGKNRPVDLIKGSSLDTAMETIKTGKVRRQVEEREEVFAHYASEEPIRSLDSSAPLAIPLPNGHCSKGKMQSTNRNCKGSLASREGINQTTSVLKWLSSKSLKWTKRVKIREGTLINYWWEGKLVKWLWKPAWGFLRKLQIELPWDQTLHLRECVQREWNQHAQVAWTLMLKAAQFTIAKIRNQSRRVSPGLDKENVAYALGLELRHHKRLQVLTSAPKWL